MSRLHSQFISRGLLIVCILAGAGLSLLWTSSAQAVLPPRPTVTVPSDDDDDAPASMPVVTQIYLRVTPADRAYWTVVQWQDAQGVWRDVEGWRGEAAHGEISWWVAEEDFGTGPFRWVIYPRGGPFLERVDGNTIYRTKQDILAVSQSFYLPITSSSPVGIFMTVPAHKD